MNKIMILLSGTPSGKSFFEKVAKENSWVWNLNVKNNLGNLAKGFYWDGQRNDEYYKFISEFLDLLNKHFNYEEVHLKKKIEDFKNDIDDVKRDPEGKEYSNFILIMHGVSREMAEVLKNEYGVIQIHITRRDLHTTPEKDLPLYEDDKDFEEQVRKTIGILTKDNKQE